IVLLDIILPGISGLEVLKRLKKEKMYKDVPILILSNLGQQSDKEKALKLGAIDYIVKAEVNPTDILNRVRQQIPKS
ncbi:MAG: response regulator, partial [Patescibacteria group bacterium]|nr:response regulator [Patescibacteria group bacterium]